MRLTVSITAGRGTTIRSARSRIVIARGAASSFDTLADQGRGAFASGAGMIAPNPAGTRPVTASVEVVVEAAAGDTVRTFTKSVGKVTVVPSASDPNLPPPPPPI